TDYYPFGMPMPGRRIVGGYRYAYQGQEVDPETGKEAFQLRLWDSRIGRWLTTDPAGQYASPYLGMGNNPMNGIDPDGAVYNPVYGSNGEGLLGTTESGMQGEAIIMDAKNFTQGMSDAVAMEKGFTLSRLNGLAADLGISLDQSKIDKVLMMGNKFTGYDNLSKRPDWDGYLTKKEADKWWLNKSGKPLYVDQSKISLSGVNTASFGNEKNKSFYKNFIWGMSETGKVYGTIKLTLLDPNTGEVFLGRANYLDEYDFKMDGRYARDFATWWGRPGKADSGVGYFIHSYHHAKVPVSK
ncbi:MAG: RHS repeat domain-containing protein, partial [Polaribacter sp.]